MKPPVLSVVKAQEKLLKSLRPVSEESVPLSLAQGRYLSRPVLAAEDRPAFNRSAMDGYAVAEPARSHFHVQLALPAGTKAPRSISKGKCLRVFTGSALPPNTQVVFPQEHVRLDQNEIHLVHRTQEKFIRYRAEDAQKGDTLLKKGSRLGPPELAILAQEGVTQVYVYRPVHAVHLVMGKELVAPHEQPQGAQIRDSNSALIAGLLRSVSTCLSAQKRMQDTPKQAREFLQNSLSAQADVLFISGGAGPGDHDWGRVLIQELGFTFLWSGLNLRPGKPLLAARKNQQWIFVLPGNPVSHWVTWHLCVQPLLRKLAGANFSQCDVVATLDHKWNHTKDLREVWWPATFYYKKGKPCVRPLKLQSSGDASGLAGANSLIHFTRGKTCFAKREQVMVRLVETL